MDMIEWEKTSCVPRATEERGLSFFVPYISIIVEISKNYNFNNKSVELERRVK
jgi:hypothetical protein